MSYEPPVSGSVVLKVGRSVGLYPMGLLVISNIFFRYDSQNYRRGLGILKTIREKKNLITDYVVFAVFFFIAKAPSDPYRLF